MPQIASAYQYALFDSRILPGALQRVLCLFVFVNHGARQRFCLSF